MSNNHTINHTLLERLYRTYGFEVSYEHKDIAVFLYKKGRYFGVDIVPFVYTQESHIDAELIKNKYSELGYAASVKVLTSLEDYDKELFKSFFSFDLTVSRLKKKYADFVTKQTRNLLGSKYQYVDVPFENDANQEETKSQSFVDCIAALINSDGPQLVIIEAAAGYGKTCTAYELLNEIIGSSLVRAPMFTELSRNRGAKIFRYILLDEIDLEYPTLNSELVINEIKKGRIPLIIDGFDELLDKVSLEKSIADSFSEVESMLDTIGALLEVNAKVVLTTRRTALFSGMEFDSWMQKWSDKFTVSRFSIKEPRIKDWLGVDRLQLIKQEGLPIQYIANPVILSYIKNLSDDEFRLQIEMPDVLVKQYFDRMLEREKERQNLIITVERQYEIFKRVVEMLLEFDITTESKEFFKEIIKDQNYKLLEYTRSLYSGPEKPSVENLVESLATHALLDRKGRRENEIGFINDFVLGTFIGEIIREADTQKIEDTYSNYMIELAATAYKVQSRANKRELWSKIQTVQKRFQQYALFAFDVSLKEMLTKDFEDLTIYDNTFFNIDFTTNTINTSAFIGCYFKNCTFSSARLRKVTFVDCTFDSCTLIEGEFIDSENDTTTVKCQQKNCSILQFYKSLDILQEEAVRPNEKIILNKMWNVSSSKQHHLSQMFGLCDNLSRKQCAQAINNLSANGFLQIKGNHVHFNINKIPDIKRILKVT